MRRLISAVMLLLLAVLHAPMQAQALFFDFLPADLFHLGTSEPVTLLITGIALLSLARVGLTSSRGADADRAPLRLARTLRPRRRRAAASAPSTERAA